MNHMKNALMRRRGKGIDIQILLGGNDPEAKEGMEEKTMGLAPELKEKSPELEDKIAEMEGDEMAEEGMEREVASEEEHEDEEQDRAMIAEMLGKGSLLERFKKKK